MRWKQLLVVPLVLWAALAAADSQLKNIAASTQAGATVVTLETAGAFTHSEYRPQPSMVLIDLQNVSSSPLKQRERVLELPGVKGYRVLEYKSVSGVEVTRVELTVTESAKLQIRENKNGLQLVFSDSGPAASPSPAISADTSALALPAAKPMSAADRAAMKPLPAATAAPKPTTADTVSPKPAKNSQDSATNQSSLGTPTSTPTNQSSLGTPTSTPTNQSSLGTPTAPVRIRKVGVVRNTAGIAIEIEGAKTARTMRLSAPDRLVVDVDNSMVEGVPRTINVNNADLRTIRVAQYQMEPPVTRIVLDLPGPREFDLANFPGKLVVTVLPLSKSKAETLTPLEVPARLAPAPLNLQASLGAPVLPQQSTSMPLLAEPVKPASPAMPPPAVVSAAPSISLPAVSSEQPGGGQKGSDYVFVEPKYSTPERTLTPAPATPAVTPTTPAASVSKAQDPVIAVVPAPAAPAPLPAPVAVQSKTSSPIATGPVSTAAVAAATPTTMVAKASPVTPAVTPTAAKATDAAATIAQNNPPAVPAAPAAPAAAAPVTPATTPVPRPAVNFAAEQQRSASETAPAETRKYTGEPISVNLKDVDVKDFFRLIHEISGLNIVLDPAVKGTLTLVLDDVPWDQALDVVLTNNGLGRHLEGSILRVATLETFRKEADEKRLNAEAQALAVSKVTVTRFLSYARAKEVAVTIKKLLSARGEVLADERTNALIIADIPTVIPNLDKLLTQLDRKTLEVEIEARVVAATRSFARELGSQIGFGWGNSTTSLGGAGAVGQTTTTLLDNGSGFRYPTIPGPSTSGTPTAQAIPLFSNLGVTGATSGLNLTTAVGNYRLDVVLTAAESRGLAKVLSRPRVVTQNNVTAVIRQGRRVPIVTQGQLGGPATTTYIDAFLRLTVTPQITVENTIFLTVDVENTTIDSSITVQGNPALATQQATTQVLVSDGGTVVIGGVIQTQNSVSVKQVPWLGSIPIFGNLFKDRSVSTQTQELIFFLTPKIIQT